MARVMLYESEEHSSVDGSGHICCCRYRSVDGGGPQANGVGGGCDGGDPGGDSERRYVKPKLRVVRQGERRRRER